MTEVKRMTGSGKPVYSWKDHKQAGPVSPRVQRHSRKKQYINAGNTLKVIWGIIVAVMLIVMVYSYMQLNSYKLERDKQQNEVNVTLETIERKNQELSSAKAKEVICQLAEEQLYMTESTEETTRTASIPSQSSVQTAQN